MKEVVTCPLAIEIGQSIRDNARLLTSRWLERIQARVSIDPNRIFPSEELLNHVPVLLEGIADYLENTADEIRADVPVIAKAMELGELRHSQGFAVNEILKEYEPLGGVLFNFIVVVAEEVDEDCSPSELLGCAKRLFRAISVIEQATTSQFVSMAQEQVREREDRLRGFNRMVSHELKNSIGVIRGASDMLEEPWILADEEQRKRFIGIIQKNSTRMEEVLEDLLALSRSDENSRKQRHLLLPEAAAEAVRQLRDMAEERGVQLRVAPTIPAIEVDAAAVELCLVNYISNGIKYADERKSDRWVEITAFQSDAPCTGDEEPTPEVIIEVRDNGVGVPEGARDQIFERFFRAETTTDRDGTGLGLSIVRETASRLGGRAWAEFDDVAEGSIFKIALPARRAADENKQRAQR